MSNFIPDAVFSRTVLLHYFHLKKSVYISFRFLVEFYGDHALDKPTCEKWFTRFKSDNFDLENEETLAGEECTPTHEEEVRKALEITHRKMSHITPGRWVPAFIPPPKKMFLRRLLLHYFNMKKSIFRCSGILESTYGDPAPSERTCCTWFKRFKSGNFNLEDKDRIRRPKKFQDEELHMLLIEDSTQTQEELAKRLRVTRRAISYRLKAMGLIRNAGKWVLFSTNITKSEQM